MTLFFTDSALSFIVPQGWNDRITYVERSYHDCGTIVSRLWNDRITRVKR
ncbi:hypothetical protein NEE14_009500 [Parabacteroides sp. AD58]|uniref:Uncharacterized protein n=1 Tax=Parabacteroides absconsus TaxID=2951805 RepID=A0ABZ2IN81_9BACT|nr:hypothetical protein [Parabacteroides sp. AD58]MCM6903045.1 hypothetical protein [Parabacteroides sp. AD58]